MISLEDLQYKKREDILRIAKRNGVHNIRVFGSVARGEADAESDIDLLVDMELKRSLLDLAGFLLEVEELPGCKVDAVTEKGTEEYDRQRGASAHGN
jgi:predicted nucleotidyltransferase